MFGQKKRQFGRGEEIKRNAMASLNLSPSERALFESQKIQAIPQNKLDEISGVNFSSPGLTVNDKNVKMYIADKFPVVPKLGFEEIQHLPAWITEKDVIPHEMGHLRDDLNSGESSEDSAIGYENLVKNRGFGIGSPKNATTPSVMSIMNSNRWPSKFAGNKNVIDYWDDFPTIFSDENSGRYYPKKRKDNY